MRSFILGGLIATCVWVFMTLGGVSKINQAWASYELSGKVAVAEELAKEREKAFSDSYRPDRSCGTNASELRKLECRNRADMARTQFFAQWNRANADRFPK